ncbi:MAG: endonuclease III [Ruminococcaceae bacterium]|nr:endonuclease III [Oscillospiraceae bacterium]
MLRRKEKVLMLKEIFDVEYKDAKCSLDYDTVPQLLVAVILSAQCTDARVNIVTKQLFKKCKTASDFANMKLEELENYIRPCGFYKMKAKNIISANKDIVKKYGGKVPDNMDDLLSLSGVGRKTANLILGDVYGKSALVIDTHAMRLTKRIGLTKEEDPVKIEFDLKKFVPPEYGIHLCHQLVFHGRKVCTARNPKCDICPVNMLCNYYKNKKEK